MDRRQQVETAGGLEHDHDGGEGHQARSELGKAGVVVGDCLRLPIGECSDIQRGLGHIDTDGVFHDRLRGGNDRRAPTLRYAGSSLGKLFGLSAINHGWHPC